MWFPPLFVPPTLKICTLISGCSRHIIGNSLFSTNLKESKTGEVTFGDVIQRKFIGKSYIDWLGTLNLHDVRLLEELSTNLISIS